jgi:hypothetical protein
VADVPNGLSHPKKFKRNYIKNAEFLIGYAIIQCIYFVACCATMS